MSLLSPTKEKKRRTKQGERTHRTILRAALDIASVESLEGLSIGRLANELKMSKSGLFAHFGSKEELQLSTLRAARAIFVQEVMIPIQIEQKGLPYFWKLCENWFSYIEGEVFRGGCLLLSASTEYDCRPGPIRDKIVEHMREWMAVLNRALKDALAAGHLQVGVNITQLTFETNALAVGANWAFQLFGDQHACKRARFAILSRLHNCTTETAPLLPGSDQYRVSFNP